MRKYLFVWLLLLTTAACMAQSDSTTTDKKKSASKSGFDPKRITYGGGLGATFGTYNAINVSPIIAYRFTDNFYAGPRIIYNYFGNRFFSYSNYGYGLMARYFPKDQFFVHAEYDIMHVRIDAARRYVIPVFLTGVGYYNRPFVISVLYDLLWTTRSPQVSPLQVNVGVMF